MPLAFAADFKGGVHTSIAGGLYGQKVYAKRPVRMLETARKFLLPFSPKPPLAAMSLGRPYALHSFRAACYSSSARLQHKYRLYNQINAFQTNDGNAQR
jgi:hypothetical protein